MYYKSKKLSLLLLYLTSVILSMIAAYSFTDPVHRTIVNGFLISVLVYIPSLVTYIFNPSTKPSDLGNQIDPIGISILQHASLVQFTGFKRLLFAVGVQVVLVAGFFFYFN